MAAFTINQADLSFILYQIKVAEAHAAGIPLTELRVTPEGNLISDRLEYHADTGVYLGDPATPKAIPDPHVPVGLRTVDGSSNNILPGRESWGAADQPMPRLLIPRYNNDADGDSFDPDGPFGPAPSVTNTNYNNSGSVADADPRIISNLVVDQSFGNPAAIIAALTFAGSEDVMGDLQRLIEARVTPEAADAAVIMADAALAAANLALDEAVNAYVAGNPDSIDAIQVAAEAVTFAEAALEHATAVAEDPAAAFLAVAAELGLEVTNGSLVIPNVAADEGLSAPFNAWMTFFGQFFDHGLDLITKGGNGTVYVPLQHDDPLFDKGADGIAGTADDGHANFMVLTRATNVDGTQVNTTTPFVDQNQTYTSHASHQVFLREYQTVGGRTVSTGNLLDGANGGLPTWSDIKVQAASMLGIQLTDADVFNVPLLRTDPYGNFIPDPTTGYAQVIVNIGLDGIPNTLDDVVASGTSGSPLNIAALNSGVGPVRTNHAFLDDIAHNAVPVIVNGVLVPDGDGDTGNAVAFNPQNGRNLEYDNELLDRHFITGDGRGNENIGLTAVHHIFHSEHNRQVDSQKLTILQSGDLAFVNEWFAGDIDGVTLAAFNAGYATAPNKGAYLAENALFHSGDWDGERLFQAARFATEMQYQHLVFEEFARKIQPNIDVFVFNSVTDVDPAIFSEFANTVYRFGHSMLTESMPRLFADGSADDMGLIASFLNPVAFDLDGTVHADVGAGAIVRGMTIERGNEIDEFVVGALRNSLLGLPLDLAAINIARGRDTGVPTLNDARGQLYAASGSSFLKPYDHWADFAANLKNPASIVNFIAAYGTHQSITTATTLEAKRDAAMELVFGLDQNGDNSVPVDRIAFLTGTDYGGDTDPLKDWAGRETGLNLVDLWIGGLAEKKMPFGGMLGSTFNAIFELQLENLQDGDRFYYLTRTQGQNMLNALEQNAFAKMILANTDLADPGADGIRGTADDIVSRHIGIDAFATYDHVLEVNVLNQVDYDPDNLSASGRDPTGNDPFLEAMGLGKVVRVDPTGQVTQNYIRVFGGEHTVIGGTNGNDTIIADFGDDAIWGDAGDDRIEAGAGVDLVNGGAGNDIITDSGDSGDFLKGDEGDDVIANSNGLDILMGGSGKDVFFVGVDATEVFGGEGDDFILGGDDADFLLGNEGDDWIEGGGGFDTTAGDNSELFFNSAIKGHDVMFAGNDEHDFDAESGDDIMVQGESVMRNEGMFGFDWSIFKGVAFGADADLRVPIFTTEQADILRNRFDKVEALSGWNHDDILRGDDRVRNLDGATTVGTAEGVFFQDELTQAGVDRIDGLRNLLGNLIDDALPGDREAQIAFDGGNILLGGGGSDLLQGNGGDDVLDGDAWLNVRIRITGKDQSGQGTEDTADNQIASVDSLRHVFTALDAGDPSWVGKSLFELMISRTIVPSQMHIVREIIADNGVGDVDVAVFNDVIENYTITANANGTVTVTQNAVTAGAIDPLTGRNLVSDGTDTLRNIEILRFANGVEIDLRNSPPVAGTDTVYVSDATNIVIPWSALLANDMDVDGDTLFITAVTPLAGVGANITTTLDALARTITFTTPNLVADDLLNNSFSYSVSDGRGGIATGTVNVRVLNANNGGADTENISAQTYDFAYIDTGAGNDAIAGGAGVDHLFGGADNDTISGGAGNDILDGGTGNDTLNGGLGDDTVNGGAGNDTASYANATGSVTVSLATGTATGADGSDTLISIEDLIGSAFNDVLTGDGNPNTLTGGAGNDRLDGGGGNDVMVGGTGNDLYVVAQAGDVVTEAVNAGMDTVEASVTHTLDINVENLTLTGVGSINGTGNGLANIITGNSGNNTLSGGGGTDTLAGGAGNDVIDGGTGNDWVSGGAGNDTLDGGSGNDIIIGGSGNDTIALASGGDDILVYNATGTGADTVTGFDANPAGGQDRIDLTAFGITAANFAAHVTTASVVGPVGTLLTITDVTNSPVGTIRLNGVAAADISAADFILDTGPIIGGTAIGNTLNSTTANETINGYNGDDIINWEVGDGRDTVNGGAGTDTFNIVGDGQDETFRVYSRAEAQLAIAGLILGAGSDIVITRAVNNGAQVVLAELSEVEEIVINPGGGSNVVQFIGNFAATALSLNTLTINGESGNDTIDVSSLTSAHRIVFRSNGGNDTVIGTLRPQDVIELAPSQDISTYSLIDNGNGTKSFTNGAHSITFTGPVPQFQNDTANGDVDDDDGTVGEDNDDTVIDDDGSPTPVPPVVAGLAVTGTAAADVMMGSAEADVFSGGDGDDIILGGDDDDTLMGGEGSDLIKGDAGRDMIFGGVGDDVVLGGADNDMIFGDAGEDRLFGDDGDDMLEGGGGSDTVYGGAGNDRIIARQGDGDDIYWGDAGNDTLDYAAITANLTIDLGNGTMQHGSVYSSQSGHDAIFGFENVIGGSGNDEITASVVANVMDGGGGDDVFVFRTAADADGDRINGFTSGDKIDLSGMNGSEGFTLETTVLTGAGQVLVTHLTGDDGEALTRIQGNVSDGAEADFTLEVAGRHLTQSDFIGVA